MGKLEFCSINRNFFNSRGIQSTYLPVTPAIFKLVNIYVCLYIKHTINLIIKLTNIIMSIVQRRIPLFCKILHKIVFCRKWKISTSLRNIQIVSLKFEYYMQISLLSFFFVQCLWAYWYVKKKITLYLRYFFHHLYIRFVRKQRKYTFTFGAVSMSLA